MIETLVDLVFAVLRRLRRLRPRPSRAPFDRIDDEIDRALDEARDGDRDR